MTRTKDPLDPGNVLRGCRWMITTRGTKNQKIVNPCNMTYDSRSNSHHLLHAVMAIVRIIKVVLPLAAAAQTGRCPTCSNIKPWYRRNSLRGCETCVPRNAHDQGMLDNHEAEAQKICGLKARKGWSLSTEIL